MIRIALAGIFLCVPTSFALGDELRVAFGEVDITPEVGGKKTVWLAGYGHGRAAEGVHDPIMARAVVLDDGKQRMALVSVDLVGLQYPTVLEIRAKLKSFAYVMVSSTHNHEGPDVIGLWGKSPLTSGVDPDYLALVVDRVAKLVRDAETRLAPVSATYGTAEDETLLGDSRLPKVYDGVLRVVCFRGVKRSDAGALSGILVQWNCHPEAMGSKNKQVTADFPWATVAALKKKYRVPVAYFSGAVGGLMAPPRGVIKDETGAVLRDGDFKYTQLYGEAVARLTEKAVDACSPLKLTPFAVHTKAIAVPLANPVYRLGRSLGVLTRDGLIWTGDFEKSGERINQEVPGKEFAVETEVAYLRLGDLHVACIPGEIYPELVYGKYQDPVDAAADFPDAPLEPPVMKTLPGEKKLLFGLANDEIGYIIPTRQWDQKAPFCYGRKTSQYGEINSVGPEAAPIITQALVNRVREAESKAPSP
jgi:hypothetical protein